MSYPYHTYVLLEVHLFQGNQVGILQTQVAQDHQRQQQDQSILQVNHVQLVC